MLRIMILSTPARGHGRGLHYKKNIICEREGTHILAELDRAVLLARMGTSCLAKMANLVIDSTEMRFICKARNFKPVKTTPGGRKIVPGGVASFAFCYHMQPGGHHGGQRTGIGTFQPRADCASPPLEFQQ